MGLEARASVIPSSLSTQAITGRMGAQAKRPMGSSVLDPNAPEGAASQGPVFDLATLSRKDLG